jgi:hypothetical protein
MARENALAFHARRVRDGAVKWTRALRLLWQIERARSRVARDPAAREYTDVALTPPDGMYDEPLELFDATDSARQAVAQARARARAIERPPAGASREPARAAN